jgi:hypothetical protein
VRLRVKTANVKDANTDDSVMVRLGNGPGTWIDSSIDDHERGRTYTYDLIPQTIGNRAMKIRDIRSLKISKTGSNGWCIQWIELIVNGRVIFRTAFPGGHWLDNSNGKLRTLSINSLKLRTNSRWELYKSPNPNPVIPRLELEQRIESIFGHHLHSKEQITWGKRSGRGVEVSYKNSETLHVDLDLKIVVKRFPDAGLDVDFDIVVRSRNGRIEMTVTNLESRVSSKAHRALLAANGFLGGTNSAELARSITRQIRQTLGGRPVSVSTGNLDLTVLVTAGGNVVLFPKG